MTPVTTTPAEPGAPGAARGAREPLLRHLVGGILRRARLAQGRTLQEVAATARMSTAYLSEVERGRKEASSEMLAAVCGALGIRLVDLVAQAHDALAATTHADRRGVRVLTSTASPVRTLRTGPAPARPVDGTVLLAA
ncbi:helix-turn-helix protein [Isoptericola jiangsuensis]|uniref:Helix-turn-helix protein n=1 Tax=Isoptericola jiangsuensis TaxID=548579 RepID=A0A2A9F062_9MICO|nr:helix-turn-helix domain-containing protein [Isoptericola jiangsuensis]PFG44186.1 helix-turn-helix protein [Isoptericola jiangsuensis]